MTNLKTDHDAAGLDQLDVTTHPPAKQRISGASSLPAITWPPPSRNYATRSGQPARPATPGQ